MGLADGILRDDVRLESHRPEQIVPCLLGRLPASPDQGGLRREDGLLVEFVKAGGNRPGRRNC